MSSSWKLESSHAIQAPGSTTPASDESGRPTLPATSHGQPAGGEHRAEQVGRRRLAVRPGDAGDRVGEHPGRQLDLAPDGHAGIAGSLDLLRLRGNPRALDNSAQSVHRHNVTPENRFDAQRPKPPHLDVGPAVGREHLRAGPHPRDRLAGGDPASRQADDQVPVAGHRYFEKKR